MILSLSDFGMRRTRSTAASPWGSMRTRATSFLLEKSLRSQYSERVGLPGAGRADEERMEDHVLVVDMLCPRARSVLGAYNGRQALFLRASTRRPDE